MKRAVSPYLKTLWSPKNPPPAVREYLDAHSEFNSDWITSDFPYFGSSWNCLFRRTTRAELDSVVVKEAGWKLRHDDIQNNLTADLIAAAEILGEKSLRKGQSAGPGGIGVSCATIRIPLLDGAVVVDFIEWEGEYNNRVYAVQRTLVTAPMAFRVLLELLGVDPPKGRLSGESRVPKHSEVVQKVIERLTRNNGSGI